MLHELIWAVLLAAASLCLHAGVGAWAVHVLRHRRPASPLLTLIGVTVLLLLTHFAGAALWAVFYLLKGGFETFEMSVYFSITSYTTIGYGDLVLPKGLRVLGALEGMVGTLLFGISVAVLVRVVQTAMHDDPRRDLP